MSHQQGLYCMVKPLVKDTPKEDKPHYKGQSKVVSTTPSISLCTKDIERPSRPQAHVNQISLSLSSSSSKCPLSFRPPPSPILSSHSRLWDYLNSREEETLDTLPEVAPSEVTEDMLSARNHPLSSQQEEVWLNYEPDVNDLEFI